jgi:hypothetical protein
LTGQEYSLNELKRKVVALKGKAKIYGLVKKNKWRIAAELARSNEDKVYIYACLRDDGKFHEAQTVYEYLRLDMLGEVPVQQSEIDLQARNDLDAYLSLPVPPESNLINML